MGPLSVTVPTATMRATRISSRVAPFAPRSPTLPVQLTFCPVSSLSTQPRACRSSTNGWVQVPAGHPHRRAGHARSWSRCATARPRDSHPPSPRRAPSHPTLHLDCARSRACPVIIITAHTASPLLRTVPCPQVLVTLSSFETSKPNKPGARFV